MNERTVCPWSGCTHGMHADEPMDLCNAVKDLCSCNYWILDAGYWITGYCDIQSLSIYVDLVVYFTTTYTAYVSVSLTARLLFHIIFVTNRHCRFKTGNMHYYSGSRTQETHQPSCCFNGFSDLLPVFALWPTAIF